LQDRNGNGIKTFGKTIGSNSYDAVCSDLVDAKLVLYKISTSWSTKSVPIATLDLNGVNSHDITVSVDSLSASAII
jgi:hypothetical protein